MLKKLSVKTNLILIGIVVGIFVGVSIRQALGDTTDVPGTARADNLTVNMSANTENGLIVANGNLLVPNGKVGIGTTTPTTSLDVVGDIKTTGSIKSNNLCIGVTCINENQLKALLAVGGVTTTTCSISGQTQDASGVCACPSGQDLFWGSCIVLATLPPPDVTLSLSKTSISPSESTILTYHFGSKGGYPQSLQCDIWYYNPITNTSGTANTLFGPQDGTKTISAIDYPGGVTVTANCSGNGTATRTIVKVTVLNSQPPVATPTASWSPTSATITSGGVIPNASFSSTGASYCNVYPDDTSSTPSWGNTPTSWSQSNMGPFTASFKHKLICYNSTGVASAPVYYTLTVTPVSQTPVMSSVSPTAVSYGGTVVITGSGFDSNSYVSMANLDPRNSGWTTILPTAYTSTTLTITIPTVASFGASFVQQGPVPYKVLEKGSNVSTQLPAPYLFVSTSPVSVNPDGSINLN